MGSIEHIQKTFQKEFKGIKDSAYNYKAIRHARLIGFRKEENSVVRLERPTNLARARRLGYKAKKGIIVARVRVRKGSGKHMRPKSGRRPKRMGVRKLTRKKNIQAMAEVRASVKFPGFEVLNSYYIGEDGQKKYFEVILVNPYAPEIKNDRSLNWILSGKHRGRAERGLTSRGKKGRGLRRKGIGTEKIRPSLRAKHRQGK